MQQQSIKQLRAAYEAVPPGDWRYADDLSAVVYISDDKVKCAADLGKIDDSAVKGEFISAAHKFMPGLLALHEAVSATIDSDGDLLTMDMGAICRAMKALNPDACAINDVPDHSVKVTAVGGPQEQVEWKISQNLTDRWGEINYHNAKNKPLALLEDDADLLERLRAQMWDELTFITRKDGQFGILFEVEYCSIESEGEEAVGERPYNYKPHATVVAALLKEMLPLVEEYPGVSFAVPDKENIVNDRPAAWAFVPDGLLNAEQREKLGMALLKV